MVVGGHLISDFISDTKSILSFSFFFVVVVVVFEREERKESEWDKAAWEMQKSRADFYIASSRYSLFSRLFCAA